MAKTNATYTGENVTTKLVHQHALTNTGIIERRNYSPTKTTHANIPLRSSVSESELFFNQSFKAYGSHHHSPPKRVREVMEIEERCINNKFVFICNYCPKQYLRKGNARNHIQSHTTETTQVHKIKSKRKNKSFPTEKSDDKFGETQDQISQQDGRDTSNSVTPNKEFVCHICGLKYNHQGWLRRHLLSCKPCPMMEIDELLRSFKNASPTFDPNYGEANNVEESMFAELSCPTNSITNNSKPMVIQKVDGENDSIVIISSDEDEMANTDSTNPRKPICYIYAHDRTFSFWDSVLNDPSQRQMVAPVAVFKHAPLATGWEEIARIGMCLEIKNPVYQGNGTIGKFWIGRIQDVRGYLFLIDFETFGTRRNGDEYKMWLSFLNKDVLPLLSWEKEKLIFNSEPFVTKKAQVQIDPGMIQDFYQNPTIDVDWHLKKYLEKVNNTWTLNENCEALDIQNPHQNRLGYVKEIKGNLILIKYYMNANYSIEEFTDGYDKGFWCHFTSDHVHKLGWSREIGMDLNGGNCKFTTDPLVFSSICQIPQNIAIHIEEGMVLEVRHPILTSKIVGAIIIKVLNRGYFIIETREKEFLSKMTRTRFIFHLTSPYVFPMGFGKEHGIPVDFDVDHNDFTSNINPHLRLDLLPPKPGHSFRIGNRLEASMSNQAELIHPATVKTIVDHLLFLHFDGKSKTHDSNFQWVDADSSEIYPIGFAKSFGFELLGNVRSFSFQPSLLQERYPLPLEFPLCEYLKIPK